MATKKKPSAAQLAWRKKFAALSKAGKLGKGKAKRAKNPAPKKAAAKRPAAKRAAPKRARAANPKKRVRLIGKGKGKMLKVSVVTQTGRKLVAEFPDTVQGMADAGRYGKAYADAHRKKVSLHY